MLSKCTIGLFLHRRGTPVTLHAGKFVFGAAIEDLLTGLLTETDSHRGRRSRVRRIRSLLAMNEMEARKPGPASEFIILRLVELVLVEIMRSHHLPESEDNEGLP
jgi:hypothetical protein